MPDAKSFAAAGTPGWPTNDAVALAQKSGYGYGEKTESLIGANGRGVVVEPTDMLRKDANGDARALTDTVTSPLTGRQKEQFTAVSLAAERSPLVKLGLDPANISFSPEGSTPKLTALGVYNKRLDRLWAHMDSPDTVAHEAMHRAFEIIRKEEPEKAKELFNDNFEETYVRGLMHKHFGDIELKTSDGEVNKKQSEAGLKFFKDNPGAAERIEKVEALAADILKRRKPMGPR